ncbi:MAG TPA: hypothetical protein VFV99_32275 [Kofleriaceae bacterium]|nr:hypothetical protein [Kofleriaceae bacterium]
MKHLAALLVVVGCASGRSNVSGTDGGDIIDPRVDGQIEGQVDAALADAKPPVDAQPIDAFVPPDAPPPPPDASVQMPDAYQCTVMTRQLLTNPVLDLTPVGTGWTLVNIDNAYPVVTDQGLAAHTAPYKAWMGGFEAPLGQSVTDQLYQDVTVPMGTTQLTLTGYYVVGTQETTTTSVYDSGQLGLTQTNGTPIQTVLSLSNLTTTGATWTAINFTFPQNLSGQTVRLRMTSTNDDSFVTNFFFDSFALTATYCQ